MKGFLLLMLMLPAMAAAQTKEDYKNVMAKFVKYYNNNQIDSICTLFPDEKSSGKECFYKWAEGKGGSGLEEYGPITDYSYLGKDETDQEKVTVFKVDFSKKGTKAMSFTLGSNNKFGTFRFETSSDEIEKMLQKKQ